MRLTVPKRKTFPISIISFIVILAILLIGMFSIHRIIKNSFDKAINTYDSLSEDTAAQLYETIEGDCRTVKIDADLIGRTGNIDKAQINDILPLLASGNTFYDLAIVDKNGKGYNLSGGSIDVSGETYFSKAMAGEVNAAGLKTGTGGNLSVFVYSAPIYKEDTCLGVLIAKKNIQINEMAKIDDAVKQSSVIYIIDENNNQVYNLYGKTQEPITYGNAEQDGLLQNDYSQHKPFILRDFFGIGNEHNKVLVWYRKPIGINNWSLVIGKTDIFNPFTQNIIRVTNIMWVFILAGIFVFFLLLVIIQRRSNRKLTQMLYLDPVTGGGNWYKFRNDINKVLKSRQFLKKKYALINFDINRFKVINDSFGHQTGDEVLKNVYYVIKKWAKPGELYTRYAADQFYILLLYKSGEEVTDRILDLNNRLHLLKNTKTIKFYFGVYFITERIDSVDRMGDFAGIAKQKIKGSTEEIISYFDDAARIRILEEEKIEKTMQDALNNNEFVVYLQPKYATVQEKISGAEALVRWDNGDGNLISPGYFIPVFEKNGFIIELDHYMLQNICRIQKSWLDKGYTPVPVSVNISRVNFSNPHLADNIKNIVDQYQVPHELIELELTESAFLQNKQILINTVKDLRDDGFLVSMDDFGAGYSSLNSLKDLPLDVVKLDGELFRVTKEIERGQTVIRNTILMAKDLHMKVVAECIETKEQVDFLSKVGCDIIQGYYFAKPMPVEQFEVRYLAG